MSSLPSSLLFVVFVSYSIGWSMKWMAFRNFDGSRDIRIYKDWGGRFLHVSEVEWDRILLRDRLVDAVSQTQDSKSVLDERKLVVKMILEAYKLMPKLFENEEFRCTPTSRGYRCSDGVEIEDDRILNVRW